MTQLTTLSRYDRYLSDFSRKRAVGALGPAAAPVTPRRFAALGESRARAALAPVSTVYVASPLGFSELGRGARELLAKSLRACGFVPIDPWDFQGVAPLTLEDVYRIGARNFRAIETSSMLVAVLEGAAPDSGTACEVGYALGLGMSPMVLRTDPRGGRLLVEEWVSRAGGDTIRSISALEAIAPEDDLQVPVAILDEYEPYLRAFHASPPRWRRPLTPHQFARRRGAGQSFDELLETPRETVLVVGGPAHGDMLAREEVLCCLEALKLQVIDAGDVFDLGEVDSAGRLFVVMDGAEVDVTAAAAIGYAAAHGVRVDALRTDPRPSGECTATCVNLQVAHGIYRTGGMIVTDGSYIPELF